MNKIVKTLSLVMLTVLAGILGWAFLTPKGVVSSSPAHLWKEYYDNKEKRLLGAIQKRFKIPTAQFNEPFDRLTALKAKDPLFYKAPVADVIVTNPDHAITKTTKRLLKRAGLNPEAVSIILDNNETQVAYAYQTIEGESIKSEIIMNGAYVEKLGQTTIEAIISHEIVHLLKYDVLVDCSLEDMLKEAGYSESQITNDPCMVAYNHMVELRADQLAAVNNGITTTKAFAKYFNEIPQHNGTCVHPAPKKRAAQMKVVLNHLQQSSLA